MSAPYAEALLDAHVHFHAGFSRREFFAAARRNLSAGGRQLGVEPGAAVGLMLTESAGTDFFERLFDEAASVENGAPANDRDGAGHDWRARRTAEDNALWLVGPSDAPSTVAPATERPDAPAPAAHPAAGDAPAEILVIAGRQLVTRERLEVLALGCRAPLPDGMELAAARDAVIEAGGVPVVPWGFGKWWGARGRAVDALLEAESPGAWYLGDNAGRPRLWGRPKLFERAARRGVWVLPGSDPLPLPGQDAKVGRCGFLMTGALDRDRPAAAVLAWLRARAEQPRTFGRYEGLGRFARDQMAMQLRKRGTAGAAMGATR